MLRFSWFGFGLGSVLGMWSGSAAGRHLALVDEGAAVGGHVDECAHLHLPARLVQLLEVGRDLGDVLLGSGLGLGLGLGSG